MNWSVFRMSVVVLERSLKKSLKVLEFWSHRRQDTVAALRLVCVQKVRYMACNTHAHAHTHTHPFNGPFSGTTQVSRYQKGGTNLDFTKARDSEWQWHQLGH